MYFFKNIYTFGVGWQIIPGFTGDVAIGEETGVRGEDGGSTALTVIPSFRRSNV